MLRVFLYLVPVGVSFAMLQLSLRHVYWRGAGDRGYGYFSRYSTNEALTVLQIVAKAHEVLIVLSISHVVLHYLRRQLISPEEIPFGLLTSAYQVTLGGAPFSYSLWNTCKRFIRRKAFNWQAFSLVLLLILATVLGLTFGPASAIAIIPRLDWWQY